MGVYWLLCFQASQSGIGAKINGCCVLDGQQQGGCLAVFVVAVEATLAMALLKRQGYASGDMPFRLQL